MEGLLHFFRDTLTGFNYFVYALIIIFFIFATIGYMLTESYKEKKRKS